MTLAFLFEVTSIQAYLFATGKLRDASGASELVSSLAFEGPDASAQGAVITALKATSLADHVSIFRCAGGVVDLTCDDRHAAELRQFRTLWRLAVARVAPGLGFVDAIAQGDGGTAARGAARQALLQSPPPAHHTAPPAAPVIRPAALSDMAPALWLSPDGTPANDAQGRCKITQSYADAPTLAKRQFIAKGSDILPRLFVGGAAGDYKWPLTFEPEQPEDVVFPFNTEVKRVALLHSDGNGVGQFFADLPESVDRRAVSAALAQATKAAAASAMKAVLAASEDNVVPARPILLGGDDLTIILRADLAFDFAKDFATAFQKNTRQLFSKIPGLEDSNGLTAKTGIVFMGPKQPFIQAYTLCEALANAARAAQSRVSFWRLTGAMIPQDAAEIQSLTTQENVSFWHPSWDWETFGKLQDLAEIMRHEDIGRGALRRVPELALSGEPGAGNAPDQVYQRALHVLRERAPEQAEAFVQAMGRLGVETPETGFSAEGYSPLLDAHVLGRLAAPSAAQGEALP